jgi:hypothetical protein
MPEKNLRDEGHLILEFLKNPYSQNKFDSFFKICSQLTIGFLRYLAKKEYNLPKDSYAGLDPIHDLVDDILGSFLRSELDRPFILVFEFFNKLSRENLDNLSPSDAFRLFKSLLFSFIRQELSRLRKEADPQLENLKQRFKVILKGEYYHIFQQSDDNISYVKVANENIPERTDRQMIAYNELLILAEDAYLGSKTRSQWCKTVFKNLENIKSVRNALKMHELLSAVVTVNAKYSLCDSYPTNHILTADYLMNRNIAEDLKAETLIWLSEFVLRDFIRKKKINPDIADKFHKAAGYYLSDMINSSNTDSIPAYFREVMPTEYHNTFNDYKYVFSTTLNKAQEYFEQKLKKYL